MVGSGVSCSLEFLFLDFWTDVELLSLDFFFQKAVISSGAFKLRWFVVPGVSTSPADVAPLVSSYGIHCLSVTVGQLLTPPPPKKKSLSPTLLSVLLLALALLALVPVCVSSL